MATTSEFESENSGSTPDKTTKTQRVIPQMAIWIGFGDRRSSVRITLTRQIFNESVYRNW